MNGRLPDYFRLGDFGISPEDVVQCTLHCSPAQVGPRVILMPSWGPEVFAEVAEGITETVSGVWQLRYAGKQFTVVRSGIGAPLAGEAVLALGCTDAETLVFTGSFGGLENKVDIGDLLLVEKSVCGDGFSRYLSPSVVPGDCLEQPVAPDAPLSDHLGRVAQNLCRSRAVTLHRGTIYSIDCVLPQFFRLGHFVDKLGCCGLEMETAAVFRAARLVGIKAAALLAVSDNPVQMKSLYSGRTKADRDRRLSAMRRVLAPAILDALSSF